MTRERDPMPTTVLWWGIGLLVGGALLLVFAADVLNAVMTPNTEAWSFAYAFLAKVLSVLEVTLPPLGAALIAASLVMRYLDRRLAAGEPGNGALRWVFPRDRARS
ncbi:hypothetical protein GE115_05245 [Agromyces sp. CFH 90414]|uniref:Uncharacterized protein n=1 Tax=Agromyces agglutinans TaxID=2662258 RepID=A0A6I2F6A4_9MICO|nr:hypothetical protein [Agromyces agglutinans]MRG59277.1 hypothetical protein [Agromyces agglutinans]